MIISDEELLSIIEQVTDTLGQILVTHRDLSEGLLDQTLTIRGKEKIDSLKKRIDDEKENLARIRHTQQRKKDLERLRQKQDKELTTPDEKTTQNEGKGGSRVPLLNQRGQLVGWIQSVGRNRVNILNQKGQVVAREVDGRTFNDRGQYQGRGKQGLRVLGIKQRR